MTDTAPISIESQELVDQAVAQGGAYEVLNKRLHEQSEQLRIIAQNLNAERVKEFGKNTMEIIGRTRIQTVNNCIPRDIVRVGDYLLLGYNVFIGLKKETTISDVFALYKLEKNEENFEAVSVPIENTFLTNTRFVSDFTELYAYYKNTKLVVLTIINDKLLACFQIGERITDMRVFRWSLPVDNQIKHVEYIDFRGERDIILPPAYDFEWTTCQREAIVDTGRRVYMDVENTLFIEQQHGRLTVKVENNTSEGQIIRTEKVDDENQALGDIKMEYASLGTLLLLKILPYRETKWRYLVYNRLTEAIERIDMIGFACQQLPEDHGIIFPGGYYLQNGEYKTFDIPMYDMRFVRSLRSPGGEDVLYVFYEPVSGSAVLLSYDVITRTLQPPILCHGLARLEDGSIVVFKESQEPSRIHPMQIWQTPYCTAEFAARQPPRTGFFGRIGNIELVRCISDLYELCSGITNPVVSVKRYTLLTQKIRTLFDAYHWLSDPLLKQLPIILKEIASTADMVLDEYEKVLSIRNQSAQALEGAQSKQSGLISRMFPEGWDSALDYVNALNELSAHRGLLLTIKDYRYIDVATIEKLLSELNSVYEQIAQATAGFMAGKTALQPFLTNLEALHKEAQEAKTVSELSAKIAAMQTMAGNLDMLTSLIGTLQIEDATQRTQIVEAISEVYAKLNQTKAKAEQFKITLDTTESIAQFSAQFQLFGQSVLSALSLAQDPEKCDEQLSRLLVQLEELESQFGTHEEFLNDILVKREEVLEAFESRKQALLDERQRKAQGIQDAARRILETLPRRTAKLTSPEEINAFFAADLLIIKLKDLVSKLRGLHDSVRADDIESRMKSAHDTTMRALRDKTELFEDDGNIIKLGAIHRFSVNSQELDLTLLPRENQLCIHLTGTEFLEPVNEPELLKFKEYWYVNIESETPTLYRSEYLAAQILQVANQQEEGLSIDLLKNQTPKFEELNKTIRDFTAPRYKEGYEKGIHDHDAALILSQLIAVNESAGLLIYLPRPRAIAALFWQHIQSEKELDQLWVERARTSQAIFNLFGRDQGLEQLQNEIINELGAWLQTHCLYHTALEQQEGAEYLVKVLASDHLEFFFGKHGKNLLEELYSKLTETHLSNDFDKSLGRMSDRVGTQWQQIENALLGLCQQKTGSDASLYQHYMPEAIALYLLKNGFPTRIVESDLHFTVKGLMGTHPRINNQEMVITVDDFYDRVRQHQAIFIPNLHRYHSLRQEIINNERDKLHLESFKPKPLTSFVRNKLINDVYLPVIGDNLAKQIGTIGENKRTDLMGMLMLISPPGYGKTTLMEYVAHRLGLIFMKVNGPALGHSVVSVDPSLAPDVTARQELEKLNLALEMGNNVMLYVDDIQHTSPEFLQKFIPLCDATRRIEGVWRGKPKTYDMRGKRFCVVMAGNPYTESGEVFKIPDMLANRADIYNLGETLGGMEEAFALSYIENALTSNPALAPLAVRDMADVYHFVNKAQGRDVSSSELSHHYSASQINDIVNIIKRMIYVREVLLRVNRQYIASAAQADQYRKEPAFRLQGSYRNMNKLVEKISSVMNDNEMQLLLQDHYQGEAQLLTTGAEENLLRLAELRGVLTPEQEARWKQIKEDFLRNKAMGGSDTDTGTRVVAQLHDLVSEFKSFARYIENKPDSPPVEIPWKPIMATLKQMTQQATPPEVHVSAPPVEVKVTTGSQPEIAELIKGIAATLEKSFLPVMLLMDKKLEVDLRTHRNITNITNGLRKLAQLLGHSQIIETTQENDISKLYDDVVKKDRLT